MPQHNNFIEKIVDIETGEESVRTYSETEKAQVQKYLEEANERQKVLDEKNAARAALLIKLGITEEEAKLLLG